MTIIRVIADKICSFENLPSKFNHEKIFNINTYSSTSGSASLSPTPSKPTLPRTTSPTPHTLSATSLSPPRMPPFPPRCTRIRSFYCLSPTATVAKPTTTSASTCTPSLSCRAWLNSIAWSWFQTNFTRFGDVFCREWVFWELTISSYTMLIGQRVIYLSYHPFWKIYRLIPFAITIFVTFCPFVRFDVLFCGVLLCTLKFPLAF